MGLFYIIFLKIRKNVVVTIKCISTRGSGEIKRKRKGKYRGRKGEILREKEQRKRYRVTGRDPFS